MRSPACGSIQPSDRAAYICRQACRASATAGMTSAGRNSRLPSWCAQVSRSPSFVVAGAPRPIRPKPARRDQAEDEQAIAEIAEPGRRRGSSAPSAPRRRHCRSRLRLARSNALKQGEAAEHQPGEAIGPVERDHLPPPPAGAGRAAAGGSSWIRKAAIAVGIAQTRQIAAARGGSRSWRGVDWISRIEPIAMKMSSPKNMPTLSVAAAKAFTSSRSASSSSPMLLLGRRQRHRRDQRPDRLRMAGDRGQAERCRRSGGTGDRRSAAARRSRP